MQVKKILGLLSFLAMFVIAGCANFASDLIEGSKQAAKDAVVESIEETKYEVTSSVKDGTKSAINKAKYGAVDTVKSSAKKVSENAKTIIWIDVRSEKEFNAGHLLVEHPAELYNIPHDQISKRIADVTVNHSDKIYLYCVSGQRAAKALKDLNKLGYKNVTNKGAFRDLIKKGYSSTK